jgi:hypothetical protein
VNCNGPVIVHSGKAHALDVESVSDTPFLPAHDYPRRMAVRLLERP